MRNAALVCSATIAADLKGFFIKWWWETKIKADGEEENKMQRDYLNGLLNNSIERLFWGFNPSLSTIFVKI